MASDPVVDYEHWHAWGVEHTGNDRRSHEIARVILAELDAGGSVEAAQAKAIRTTDPTGDRLRSIGALLALAVATASAYAATSLATWGLSQGYSFGHVPFVEVPFAAALAAAAALIAILATIPGRPRMVRALLWATTTLALVTALAVGLGTLVLILIFPGAMLVAEGDAGKTLGYLVEAIGFLVAYLIPMIAALALTVAAVHRRRARGSWGWTRFTFPAVLAVVLLSSALAGTALVTAGNDGSRLSASLDSNGVPIGSVSRDWIDRRAEAHLLYPTSSDAVSVVYGEDRAVSGGTDATAEIDFNTDADPQAVLTWYRDQLQSRSWGRELGGRAGLDLGIADIDRTYLRGDREEVEVLLEKSGVDRSHIPPPGKRRFQIKYTVIAYANQRLSVDRFSPPSAQASPSPPPLAAPPITDRPTGSVDLAYDSGHKVIVSFGGGSASTSPGETWTWDGLKWTRRVASPSPPVLDQNGLVYDETRHQVVLFESASATGRSETWTWDGDRWTNRLPRDSPTFSLGSQASYLPLTYDPGSGYALLVTNGVWAWDGGDWRQLTTAASGPGDRCCSAVGYDPVHAQVVLVGGSSNHGGSLNDTWTWAGNAWSQASPAMPAPYGIGGRLVYAGPRSGLALLGGVAGEGRAPGNATWFWDGSNWSLKAVSPRSACLSASVYNSDLQRLQCYAGIGGTAAASIMTWDPLAGTPHP